MKLWQLINTLVCLSLVFNLALGAFVPAEARGLPQQPGARLVDIVFIVDTSGSMDEEFSTLCGAIEGLARDLEARSIRVRYTILGISETRQCATQHVAGSIPNATSTHQEDWGPAVRDVSVGYAWQPGYTRLVVPMSDEGPYHGSGPCAIPGDDEDSIVEAITAANSNNVRVAPILGNVDPGAEPACVESLAERLASGTGGAAFYLYDDATALANGIMGLIEAVAEDRDGDGIPDEDDPAPDDACSPDPQAVCLPRQVCGLSNTPHWDDDGDGRTDEETQNLADDDGDTLIDEDVGGVNCPFPDQDCGVNSHRGFDDDEDGRVDEETDNGRDDDGDGFLDEDVACACPPEQDRGNQTLGVDDDLDFFVDEEVDDGIDNDDDGCVDEDIGATDYAGMVQQKKDLISSMSDLDIDWLGLSVPDLPLVELGYDESAASVLVDRYDSGGMPGSGASSRFYRLMLTESALYSLYNTAVTAGDTGAEALSQLIWIVVTFPSLVAGQPAIKVKYVEELIPEKVLRDVLTRFTSASARFVNFFINNHTDAPPAEKAALRQLVNTGLSHMLNYDLLARESAQAGIRYFLDHGIAVLFVELTQGALDDGTSDAISSGTPPPGTDDFASERLRQEVVGREERSEAVAVESRARIGRAQIARFVSDLFSLADAVVPPSHWRIITFGGKIIAQLFAGYELVRAVGGVYSDVNDTVQLACQVDDLAFDPDYELSFGPSPAALMPRGQVPSLTFITSIAPNAATGAHFSTMRGQLAADEAAFEQELAEVLALVQAGDAEGTYDSLDPLADASAQLLSTFEAATAPIDAVSTEATTQVSGFQEAYSAMYLDAQMYDAEVLNLYADLLHFMESPDDRQLRAQVDTQAGVVLEAIDDYQATFGAASHLAESLPLPPVAIIRDHTVRGAVAEGTTVQVTFHIVNTSPTAAGAVQLDVVPAGGVQLISPESQMLGSLPAGGQTDAIVSLRITPTNGAPFIIGNLTTDGYSAPMHFVTLSPELVVGGDMGAWALILPFAAAVAIPASLFAYSYGRRRGRVPAGVALDILSGSESGMRVPVKQATWTIGRGRSCDLRLPEDDYASREHARLTYSQGSWFIQDLDSRNGTFVNGRETQAVRLQDGDTITIGRTEMVFRQT